MIGRLRGTVVESLGNIVTVDVGGVGYEVTVPDSVLGMVQVDEPIQLRTRQIVREDAITLYGFIDSDQRSLFDLLLGVNGCGAKSSLALLGQVGEETVLNAILQQDPKPLIRATGVGQKLAERILLELRAKVQEETLLRKVRTARNRVTPQVAQSPDDEVVEALMALGYRRNEAELAVSQVESGLEVAEKLKDALKVLQR